MRSSTTRARSSYAAVGLGRQQSEDQSAFHRLDVQPCGWMKRESRLLLRSLDPASHPFARHDEAPLVRDGASVPCYRATPRFASRLPLALRRRCFSPTSATDYRNEHPNRSPDFRAAQLAPRRPVTADETSRSSLPTPRRPTPDRLAAIQPRMSMRLTALTQLRSFRSRASTPRGEQLLGEPIFAGCRTRRGVFDRERDRRK